MSQIGTHALTDVNNICLDKDNPRIRRWIEMYGSDPTPEQIHLALGAGGDDADVSGGTTYYSLKESIRSNGGIIHPIIVNRNEDGVLTVIEGNTRLAIYHDFVEKSVTGDWRQIPAVIYDSLSPEAIDAIRLQSHLVGPRAWDPYSKAKYLNYLHSIENMPFERLVDYCGGRRKEVQDYIAAYYDMETYYRPLLSSDSEFDTTRFSGFVELQRTKVKNAILSSGFGIDDFAKWIDGRLIDPLNTVRQLPKILENDTAKQIFLDEGAREALKVFDRGNPKQSLQDASLTELCQALTRKLSQLGFNDAQRLKDNPDSDHAQAVLDLQDEISNLVNFIEPEDVT